MIFKDEKCIAVAYLFHKFGSRNADNISKCETVSLFYIHSTILFISHLHFFSQSCLLPRYFSAIRTAAAALLSSFSILLVFPLIANATARYNWLLPACSGSSCLTRLVVCVCVSVWLDKVLAKLVGLCSSATRATYRTWTRYSWHNISKIRKKLPAYYWHWAKRSIARKTERRGERERQIDEPDMRDNTRDAY